MERRINKLKPQLFLSRGFDILVTHAAAYGLGDGKDLCHTGFKCFNKLLDIYEPKYYFHGHQHLNYNRGERLIRYKDTTIINSYGYYIIDVNINQDS